MSLYEQIKELSEKRAFVLNSVEDAGQIEDFTWFVDCTDLTRVLYQDPEFGDRRLFEDKDEAVSLATMLNFAQGIMGLLPSVLSALKGQEDRSEEWTVQNSGEFYGQEVETWKSKSGLWGFAYGTELSGVLAAETLVTGFASEEEAFTAANQHCYESAWESAASQGDES